jgi:hypothetical protein
MIQFSARLAIRRANGKRAQALCYRDVRQILNSNHRNATNVRQNRKATRPTALVAVIISKRLRNSSRRGCKDASVTLSEESPRNETSSRKTILDRRLRRQRLIICIHIDVACAKVRESNLHFLCKAVREPPPCGSSIEAVFLEGHASAEEKEDGCQRRRRSQLSFSRRKGTRSPPPHKEYAVRGVTVESRS